ncbi:hypothetical protein L1D24_04750 [Vibrio brasiliensis]|uniref:hypothetical protein n=1 Tax=Vibrio brasiliensis TaxID=170652 RepID=UPI001EFC667B|nr:hypothetical protein [Vibrio brasiliensis]MCG9647878.1 hypothetical protein [Vibrio brasiliensis]
MEDIENELEDSVELDKFTIALPLREIVHAHLHYFRYEERFREKEERHKEPEIYLQGVGLTISYAPVFPGTAV